MGWMEGYERVDDVSSYWGNSLSYGEALLF